MNKTQYMNSSEALAVISSGIYIIVKILYFMVFDGKFSSKAMTLVKDQHDWFVKKYFGEIE